VEPRGVQWFLLGVSSLPLLRPLVLRVYDSMTCMKIFAVIERFSRFPSPVPVRHVVRTSIDEYPIFLCSSPERGFLLLPALLLSGF